MGCRSVELGVAAVSGVADLLQQPHDQRRAQRLAVSRRAYVQRVARGDERVRVEVDLLGGRPREVGVIDRQHPPSGGEDRGAFATLGPHNPDQHIAGNFHTVAFEDLAGLVQLAPKHPAQQHRDRLPGETGRVQQRRQQGRGAL